MVVLVTGGARSGKSSFAEAYAAHIADRGVYVATSEILDEGMRSRIERHRLERARAPLAWELVEEPLDLVGALRRHADAPVVLIDCLTLWLSNKLLRLFGEDAEAHAANAENELSQEIARLTEVLSSYPGQAILVTNEVGDGIVPEYPLGRLYRDWAGWMNQRIAAVSDQVFLVTAGIPLELTSLAFRFPMKSTEAPR